ncbi:MAG: hypothetical protein NTZ64_07485 [Polaromonas sp.]|nr:hypothetical protein [Polaromonas sp.]
MKNIQHLRCQTVQEALMRHPQQVLETTQRLWGQLAPALISIIGKDGFQLLYARSVRLNCARYPWLDAAAVIADGHEFFTPLLTCLRSTDLVQARQASVALLNIFLNLLASLIGEALTTHLLHSAWRHETSDTPAKDFPT